MTEENIKQILRNRLQILNDNHFNCENVGDLEGVLKCKEEIVELQKVITKLEN